MASCSSRPEPPEMVSGHDGILNLAQLVLNEFDLIDEPRRWSPGTPLSELGGVTRSFGTDAHAMPFGIGGGAIKSFDFLAQLAKSLSGEIGQGNIAWHHRRLADRKDEAVHQGHITRASKLADK